MHALSPQVFAILTSLVEEKTGLHYGLAQRDLFLDRVSARAAEHGMDSLLDYYYLLRYDDPVGAELQILTEALVVNETFFFRELDQLRVLVDRLIAPAVAAGERPRIWSAACATGEEPFTIAMLLAEKGILSKVEIVATDISNRVLDKARQGIFARRSLRAPIQALVDRFLGADGEHVTARREIVDAVRFQRLNLIDKAGRLALGTFDAILCRNVLIYFRDEVTRSVVEGLSAQLRPRGALFVGVSESLLRFGTSLDCEEQGGVFFYRKPQ